MNEVNKRITTTLIAIIAITTMGTVYAEEVQFPTLPTDYMIGMNVDTTYQSDKRYSVVITVQYGVPSELQVITTLVIPNIDGTTSTIEVQKEFIEANTPVVVVDEVIEDEVTEKEQRLAERKAEVAKEIDDVYGNYRQCLEEFAEEQPVRFEAWKRTAALEEFVIPDQEMFIRHHNTVELDANKKWQVCETLKKYQWIGAVEANKVLDGLTDPVTTDVADNDVNTNPVTEEDIASEAERAEEYKCSTIGRQMGLCVGDFTGINRGGYTDGAACGLIPGGSISEDGGAAYTSCPLMKLAAHIATAPIYEQVGIITFCEDQQEAYGHQEVDRQPWYLTGVDSPCVAVLDLEVEEDVEFKHINEQDCPDCN